MDTNNWTNQGGTGGGDSTMESVDWRPQFSAEQRQKVVNRIIEALTKYSSYGPEKLHEIKNIASMVEDKFYTTSPSQYEYMKKISLKLLNISKSANPISSGSSVNPSDPGSQGMQQVNNQGQPLSTHVPSNHPQSSQQILSSALPPGSGLEQSTMSNITTQNPNLQNIQNISRVQVQQSYVGNSMPNNFVNQRQIPGRQQQQQSQNSQQMFYRHQLQQIAKHNLQQSFSATSAQSHIQQQHQTLLQPGHFQPSSLSTGQQSQQPVIQSSLRQQQRQQPQQQPRVLSNGQQPHQHSVGQQHNNNFSHVGPQSSSSQLLGTQQHSTHVMQLQSKVSIPQQNNQSMKGQLQQQVMPQLQTQSGGQLKSNMSQRDMQQRIPTSGGFQQQNVTVDQQKQVFQQQRAMPEASSTSSDSTAQTGNQNSGDWQEEVYQKIKAMRDKYMPDLKDLYPKIVSKLQQLDSLPNQPKSEQFQNMKMVKQVNEHCMAFLQLPKTNITLTHKEKLLLYEKQIVNILTTYNRKVGPTTHPQQPQSSPMFQLHMQQQLLQKQQLLQQQHKNHHHHHHQHNNRHNNNNNNNNNTVTKQQLQAIQQLPHIGVKLEPSSLHRLKPGPPFSPNIDHPLTCVTKSGTGTPANSPFTMSSPSTPSTSHVVGGDSEKVVNSSVSLPNQSNVATLPTPIGTPGISPSPLLAEFASPDENHGNDASVVSGKSSTVEQPIEHLLKVVKSISAKSLSASVSDIGSVVSMIDSIAGPGAGNNASRAAIGEDLVATTKCRLQETNNTETRKRKRLLTSEMHLNVVSSVSSVNDSFKHFNGLEASELESTATSNVIRPRIQTSNALLEEIRGINRGLIDTMVDIDADSAACSDVGKGTVVKCLFGAVALGPNLKSQYSSAKVSPIQPLRLIVPENYPHCSPLLLDKFPLEVSKEYDDLSIKAKWRFCSCMRTLSEPMSLEEMARTWDVCARAVISDYAQQSSGGGTFTSNYGAWEDCIA